MSLHETAKAVDPDDIQLHKHHAAKLHNKPQIFAPEWSCEFPLISRSTNMIPLASIIPKTDRDCLCIEFRTDNILPIQQFFV